MEWFTNVTPWNKFPTQTQVHILRLIINCANQSWSPGSCLPDGWHTAWDLYGGFPLALPKPDDLKQPLAFADVSFESMAISILAASTCIHRLCTQKAGVLSADHPSLQRHSTSSFPQQTVLFAHRRQSCLNSRWVGDNHPNVDQQLREEVVIVVVFDLWPKARL